MSALASAETTAAFLALGGAALGTILHRKHALESYPAVRRCDVAENYHGELVHDPYRWLEDPDSKETAAFVEAQQLRFNRFQASLTHRRPFLDRLRTMFDYDKVSCPFKRGEKYFMFRKEGLAQHSVMLVSDRPEGPHTPFLDPNTFSDDGTVSLGYYKFSHDGSLMAYQRCESGADWRTVVIRDVATGRDLTRPRRPDVDGPGSEQVVDSIERVKFSSIAWTHDNRGFFYCRYPAKDEAAQTAAISGRDTASIRDQTVYYHELGTPFVDDQVVFRDPANPKWLFGPEVTEDGSTLLITAHADCDPVNRVFFCDLSNAHVGSSRATGRGPEADYPLVRLVDNFDASWEYLINIGRTFYFFTNLNAPMYRIVRVTLPDRLDGFRLEDHVEDVIPQRSSRLEWATIVSRPAAPHGYAIVACSLVDVAAKMEIFDLNGGLLHEVPMPPLSQVGGFSGRPQDREIFFSLTSFTEPGCVYRYDMATDAMTVHAQTKVPQYKASDLAAKQEFFVSRDGERVPVSIVARADVIERLADRPRPCLLYAYGGFGISMLPAFSLSRAIFVRDYDCIFVVANIRGGGEYGEERWHKAGKLERKQTVFDDFIGAAEHLIKRGYTLSSKLAIQGGSNGGLLVTAVVNQRPDLFACGIAQVPVCDMLRFHKFSVGYAWISEYGCAETSADEYRVLKEYSPLHTIRRRADTQYPAMLVLTADHDDRVVPAHSFKYAATLQHELGGDPKQTRPLLLRIESKAGHGAGKPTSKLLEEAADIYATVLKFTAEEA